MYLDEEAFASKSTQVIFFWVHRSNSASHKWSIVRFICGDHNDKALDVEESKWVVCLPSLHETLNGCSSLSVYGFSVTSLSSLRVCRGAPLLR